MIWGRTTNEWHRRHFSWQPWFAWYPAKIDDGRWVWLQVVEKRYFAVRDKFGVLYGIVTERRMLNSPPELPPPTETPTP